MLIFPFLSSNQHERWSYECLHRALLCFPIALCYDGSTEQSKKKKQNSSKRNTQEAGLTVASLDEEEVGYKSDGYLK